jgi:hypothetical protein
MYRSMEEGAWCTKAEISKRAEETPKEAPPCNLCITSDRNDQRWCEGRERHDSPRRVMNQLHGDISNPATENKSVLFLTTVSIDGGRRAPQHAHRRRHILPQCGVRVCLRIVTMNYAPFARCKVISV